MSRTSRLAWEIGLRSVLIAALGILLIHLIRSTQLYATALIVAGVIAVVIVNLAQLISRTERAAEQLLHLLHTDGMDTSLHARNSGSSAFARTAQLLRITRSQTQQQVEYLQCLLDNVAACLLVVKDNGEITLANRAAYKLAAGPVNRLHDVAAIGMQCVTALVNLQPGARQIVHLANGQPMLAGAAQFSIPGNAPAKLISLQSIAGELDAVELKAWQDITRVLAHEMMNSLTPISSLSESLEYLLRDAAQRRTDQPHQPDRYQEEITGALEAIRRRSLGLMNFVERYRQVAELPGPEIRHISLGDFFRNIERLMTASFRDRRIVYTQHVEPADLGWDIDPELLEQAIINLLRNASDAVVETEQPQIAVLCRVADEQLHIAIGDNGCGLSASQREQIFVPFFSTKPGGSGIGLSLARHIALAHDGQLQVAANSPAGTVFTLVLPAAPAAATSTASA